MSWKEFQVRSAVAARNRSPAISTARIRCGIQLAARRARGKAVFRVRFLVRIPPDGGKTEGGRLFPHAPSAYLRAMFEESLSTPVNLPAIPPTGRSRSAGGGRSSEPA